MAIVDYSSEASYNKVSRNNRISLILFTCINAFQLRSHFISLHDFNCHFTCCLLLYLWSDNHESARLRIIFQHHCQTSQSLRRIPALGIPVAHVSYSHCRIRPICHQISIKIMTKRDLMGLFKRYYMWDLMSSVWKLLGGWVGVFEGPPSIKKLSKKCSRQPFRNNASHKTEQILDEEWWNNRRVTVWSPAYSRVEESRIEVNIDCWDALHVNRVKLWLLEGSFFRHYHEKNMKDCGLGELLTTGQRKIGLASNRIEFDVCCLIQVVITCNLTRQLFAEWMKYIKWMWLYEWHIIKCKKNKFWKNQNLTYEPHQQKSSQNWPHCRYMSLTEILGWDCLL